MKNTVIPALVATVLAAPLPALADDPVIVWRDNLAFAEGAPVAVSYTHLTLPTILRV